MWQVRIAPVALALMVMLPWGPVQAASSGSGWSWLNPHPNGNTITDIACAGTQACYAAGRFGTVTVTHDKGVTWHALSTHTEADLVSIDCPAASDCYAVGPAGLVIATHDAGLHWKEHAFPKTDYFYRLSCPGRQTCFVLGQDLTKVCSKPPCNLKGVANVLVTTRNGGKTWSRINAGKVDGLQTIVCPTAGRCITTADAGTILVTTNAGHAWHRRGGLAKNTYIEALTCASANVCYAGGVEISSTTLTGVFYASRNGGLTWQKRDALSAKDGPTRYGDISCPQTSVCYMTGVRGAVLDTTDGGGHWEAHIALSTVNPGRLACASAQVCHVTGGASSIVSTRDSGITWHDYTTGPKDDLSAVSCPSATACRAAGASVFLISNNGGAGWTASPLPQGVDSGYLPAMACPDASTCYLAGAQGSIERTTDAGADWSALTDPFSTTQIPFAGISCPTARDCYIIGSGCEAAQCAAPALEVVVVATHNGGATWTTAYSARSEDLTPPPAPAVLRSISCPRAATCYVSGSPGIMLKTEDSGAHWQQVKDVAPSTNIELTNLDLRTIACPAEGTCYTAGFGCPSLSNATGCLETQYVSSILATHDGGATWSAHNPGRSIDIYSSACGSTASCKTTVSIAGLACSSVNSCRGVGEDGTIVRTSDGGNTWSAEAPPTDNYLATIACPGADQCIAAGEGGTILGLGMRSKWDR